MYWCYVVLLLSRSYRDIPNPKYVHVLAYSRNTSSKKNVVNYFSTFFVSICECVGSESLQMYRAEGFCTATFIWPFKVIMEDNQLCFSRF